MNINIVSFLSFLFFQLAFRCCPIGVLFLEYILNGTTALQWTGVPEGAPNSVPQSEKLAIIIVVEQVVISVVGRAIDERFQGEGHSVVTVMDRHRPNVHKHKQTQVGPFV